MSRLQIYSIAGFVLLFLSLLFGMPTKPQDLLREERSRALNLQATDVSILKREAFQNLAGGDRATIQILEGRLEDESDTLSRRKTMEDLSSTWFALEQFGLAGHYAEMIAKESQNAEDWGIAGTTYAIGVNRTGKEKEKKFCRAKSLEALENAISQDPSNLSYQINRAVLFAEHPDPQNPMKGIMILIDLNKNFPENVPVINNLARFAIQTGQLDRAKVRLTEALALEPENKRSNCLMVDLMQQTRNLDGIEQFKVKCES